MKKMVYQQGNLKRNENGDIIGAVKGHYESKEVTPLNKKCGFTAKYLFTICCLTIMTFTVLEFCGFIGNF